ncbi:MAG: hypothetical protein GY813_13395 [Halieaceae bacterium]|nr:hypothetical protein [Halieaceae bacterium]
MAKTKTETLSEALYLRCAPSDMERLDELVERIPVASRNAIAREAMRLGMAALEKDPSLLFAKRAPKRSKKKS